MDSTQDVLGYGGGDSKVFLPMPGGDVKTSANDAPKTTNTIEARDATPAGRAWTMTTMLLLAAMVGLPLVAFIISQQSETTIHRLRENAALLDTLQCGTFNSNTGVYTLTRGGITYSTDSRDDVQFLTGFESGCATCPAVAGATYGTSTPAECIVDDSNVANRRANDIACGGEVTFTAPVQATETVVNRIQVLDTAVGASVSQWNIAGARCDSGDNEQLPGRYYPGMTGGPLADLRSVMKRARNLYFVPSGDGVGLCYCQGCNAKATNPNPAGSTATCYAVSSYAWGWNWSALEMCNYSPINNWASNLIT